MTAPIEPVHIIAACVLAAFAASAILALGVGVLLRAAMSPEVSGAGEGDDPARAIHHRHPDRQRPGGGVRATRAAHSGRRRA